MYKFNGQSVVKTGSVYGSFHHDDNVANRLDAPVKSRHVLCLFTAAWSTRTMSCCALLKSGFFFCGRVTLDAERVNVALSVSLSVSVW